MAAAQNLSPPDRSHRLDSSDTAFGIPVMNLAHKHLYLTLAQLRDADDAAFAQRLPALVATVEQNFRDEEILVEALDPATFRAHLEQQARMLAALHCTMNAAWDGDTAPARCALDLLEAWLAMHNPGMNQELANAVHALHRAPSTLQQ